MTTIIGITAFLLAAVERFSRLRFRHSPLFRRDFASDMFYLLTGFVAGGSLSIAGAAPFLPTNKKCRGRWANFNKRQLIAPETACKTKAGKAAPIECRCVQVVC